VACQTTEIKNDNSHKKTQNYNATQRYTTQDKNRYYHCELHHVAITLQAVAVNGIANHTIAADRVLSRAIYETCAKK